MSETTPPRPLRLGIVGCARILPAHLRGMQRLRDCGIDSFRITALYARNRADAEMFRLRGAGPDPRPPVATGDDSLAAPHMYVSDLHPDTLPTIYDTLEEMLAADAIDALLILTPVYLHHSQVITALDAGKHVLVEKPMAVSVRAGQAMVAAAQRNGCVLGIAECVRYSPTVRAVHALIAEGIIGDIQLYMAGVLGTTDWSPDRIVARTPWRHRKLQAGGGPTVDMAVHLFDGLRAQCGEVETVSGTVRRLEAERVTRDDAGRVIDRVANEVEDAFFATFTLRGGGMGQLFFTWAGHGQPTALQASPVIYGTRGCLRGDTFILDDGTRATAGELAVARCDVPTRDWINPLGLNDLFAIQFWDFLRAIGIQPGILMSATTPIVMPRPGQMEVDGAEGLRDLAAAYTILESAEVGRTLPVDDVQDGTIAAYQREIDAYYRLQSPPTIGDME